MKFRDIDWGDFDGPTDYRPKQAEVAVRLVMSADSQHSAREAYDKMLTAVGNNHAGTFYPAALRAAEELRELRDRSGNHWVRWTAVEVLTDWASSFRAEVGFEFFELPSGEPCSVAREVKALSEDPRVIDDADEPRS